MPSIYTHTHYSRDVAKLLKKEDIIINNNKLYELFSQSFDYLFYYNFPLIFPGKKIRDFANYCHRHNCQEYIINITKYIKENPNCKDLYDYLYGSINHYILDSTMHPYINYLAKEYNEKSAHTKIEFNIDAYYYEKDTKNKFYNYKIYNDLQKKEHFSKELKLCINDVYKNTFNVNNIGKKYEKSYNQSRILFKLFLYDPKGIKKELYKIVDKIINFKNIKLEYRSLHITKIDNSFLNSENRNWNNISNINKKYNYSWDDLYKKALNLNIEIIKACNDYIENKISLSKLETVIPNITYSNGKKIK